MNESCRRAEPGFIPGAASAGVSGGASCPPMESVRVHDRAQHDPALVRPVVAGAAVHRCALVPYQDIPDAPAVVVDEALVGRVSGELLDQRPRLLALLADEALRVQRIDEQDRPPGHRMPGDRGPLHDLMLILLVGQTLAVAIQRLAGRT